MVAVLVEVVDVQARPRGVELRPHFPGEHPVPQLLGGKHFIVAVRDEKGIPRCVLGEVGTRLISADEEL
ncbi:hypothetical protein GCM10022222_70760 [Amycolatopsis ultiminotia]|uniref:Uncharacterized protein n=1 Tax=Amycolatopsis ultiminotia TaxID=543629 RepID=A0ABP6Y1T5_9PSEU